MNITEAMRCFGAICLRGKLTLLYVSQYELPTLIWKKKYDIVKMYYPLHRKIMFTPMFKLYVICYIMMRVEDSPFSLLLRLYFHRKR